MLKKRKNDYVLGDKVVMIRGGLRGVVKAWFIKIKPKTRAGLQYLWILFEDGTNKAVYSNQITDDIRRLGDAQS